jgi:hypothetical protein
MDHQNVHKPLLLADKERASRGPQKVHDGATATLCIKECITIGLFLSHLWLLCLSEISGDTEKLPRAWQDIYHVLADCWMKRVMLALSLKEILPWEMVQGG